MQGKNLYAAGGGFYHVCTLPSFHFLLYENSSLPFWLITFHLSEPGCTNAQWIVLWPVPTQVLPPTEWLLPTSKQALQGNTALEMSPFRVSHFQFTPCISLYQGMNSWAVLMMVLTGNDDNTEYRCGTAGVYHWGSSPIEVVAWGSKLSSCSSYF